MTWCPSWPFTASGLVIVQLLLSLSLTNIFPSLLILPVTSTAFADASAFMLSCFMESWASVMPHISRQSAKQMVISFFILVSFLKICSSRAKLYAQRLMLGSPRSPVPLPLQKICKIHRFVAVLGTIQILVVICSL